MGIPKLTSFIRNYFSSWKEERLGKYLVIDGCSLCYYLYTFDWINGGQYTDFYDGIVEFFQALQASAVESIVVIDGYAYPEEKSETVKKRHDAKVQEICDQLTESSASSTSTAVVQPDSSVSPRIIGHNIVPKTDVLPFLATNVFHEVLCELNITCIMVDGEADQDIVQLANFYSCPVLSNDSDFYMFPLKGGFIHLEMLDWRTQPVTAKVYHMNAFLQQFKLGHESLRFIIPAMCGNDFLPSVQDQYKGYLQHIRRVTMRAVGRHHPIESVVLYASHYDNIEDFITRLRSTCDDYLNNEGKECLTENCIKASSQYDKRDVHSLDDLRSNTKLHLARKQPLPSWFLQQIRDCKYTVDLLMTVCAGGCELPVPIGDPNKKSSLHVSRSLRRALYSLLELHPFVVEGIFDELEWVGCAVLTYKLICEGEVITRDMLPDLELIKRKKIIYSLLHCNADIIELLEEKWRLVIASVVYWIRAARIPILIVKILILTFVLCSRGANAPNNPLKIYHSVKLRRSFLKTPTWWEGLDYFNRWQSSYKDASHLCAVLHLPLQIYSAAHIFNGEMAMYFIYMNDVSVVVSKLSSIDRELYDHLLTTVLSHKFERNKTNITISVQPGNTTPAKTTAIPKLLHVID